MERLGIKNLSRKCYRELSGGQQRRVLLARALVSARAENSSVTGDEGAGDSRRLLVLDEPAAGLDPLITVEVYELLKTLNQQTGITIIMVSHDIRGAEQYASQILHLENGKGFFGKTSEYLNSERGRKFLGQNREKNDVH
jgi:zinc transport system ATP-binding protein